tara:strand:- start:5321 stop:6205 length:885 start_codon:yes stop_codon:yes gene_type:complete
MKFKIPFTFSTLEKLKRKSAKYKDFIKPKKKSKLNRYLESSDSNISREEYLGIVLRSVINSFVFFLALFLIILSLVKLSYFIPISLAASLIFSIFIGFSQVSYPKIYNNRKQKEIECNLIPALQDMLVQLNSGIPLFTILVNISQSDYSLLSDEFKKAVKKINAGFPQAQVLEELGDKNPSLYFRRALWQISNGMRAGSNITIVIKESIKSLSEEQLIQIQNYGNKLNPMIMFYMLISVIVPALAITFLTVISSLVSLPKGITVALFMGLFFFVFIMQLTFLGAIKSLKPSLLS